jgi:hypothetical protein
MMVLLRVFVHKIAQVSGLQETLRAIKESFKCSKELSILIRLFTKTLLLQVVDLPTLDATLVKIPYTSCERNPRMRM